jgi:hypothetical protein
MSRGPGHIQRTVLDLIAADADGAWSVGEICQRIYGAVEKKHRVAVARALRRMELPGTWRLWRAGRTGMCIYNECSLRSAGRFHWLNYQQGSFDDYARDNHFLQPGGMYYESVQEAIAYRDADARGRRKLDVKHKKEREGWLGSPQPLRPWRRWPARGLKP